MSPLKHFFPLTSSFFGLTYKYKTPFLREIYICTKHLGFTYSDVMSMPVYERRFYIDLYREEMDMQTEKMEEMKQNVSSGGNGKRSRRISGEALKSKMKNNQIPNQ